MTISPPQAPALQMEQQHWRLPDACWRMMYVMQKSGDNPVSTPPTTQAGLRQAGTDSSSPEARAASAYFTEGQGNFQSKIVHQTGCSYGT